MESEKKMCLNIIENFKVGEKIEIDSIRNFRSGQSKIYSLGPVYTLDHGYKRYYLVNDYSLSDDPRRVKDILIELEPNLNGHTVESKRHFTAEGSKYIYELDGEQYYLWEWLRKKSK